MAFVGFKIPNSISHTLSKISVPGEKSSTDEMHITAVYLGKGIPTSTILEAAMACRLVAKTTPKFMVGTNRVTHFDKKPDDGIPAISKILSPNIQMVRNKIMKALDFMNISWINKYPVYQPHVTLSYSETESPDFFIEPIKWEISSISVFGADHGFGKISIDLELV